MTTTGNDDESLVSIEHQRHVLGDVVLDHAAVRLVNRPLQAPIPLRVSSRDRPGKPYPWKELGRPIDDHERTAERFIFSFSVPASR